ncbi:response regulator transcription factor [Leucobacter triazinivorans]|uniref:Response regulator transcription factor n=1 Tax=Leucobacter triazinivorans TaxID=1784719 RepID=A0A4P6KIM4_9MICO|nr:response regulator transcription factor [Leucobacter triazinivorans]
MRVLIAEDEVLLRRGLELMLLEAGMEIVGSVGDLDALLATAEAARPDLVITDIRMPPRFADEGLVAAAAIRAARPQTAVMVLSQHVQRRYAMELLGVEDPGPDGGVSRMPGRVGYLLKQRIADVDAFVGDLREVAAGGTAIDPEVIDIMVARAARSDTAVARLTERQLEVLALVAQGRSNSAIASSLFITEKAVVQHISRIYDALGLPLASDAHRRVLAVLRYLSRGAES